MFTIFNTEISLDDLLLFSQNIILTATLIFIAYQFFLQRKQSEENKKLNQFKLYHMISEQYLNILRSAIADPIFNTIWDPIECDRFDVLHAAQMEHLWGAWHLMSEDEKKCYRYTREAIETFERAFQVHGLGVIDEKAWKKWKGWISIWKGSPFFTFVFNDTKPRLIDEYVNYLVDIEETYIHTHNGPCKNE